MRFYFPRVLSTSSLLFFLYSSLSTLLTPSLPKSLILPLSHYSHFKSFRSTHPTCISLYSCPLASLHLYPRPLLTLSNPPLIVHFSLKWRFTTSLAMTMNFSSFSFLLLFWHLVWCGFLWGRFLGKTQVKQHPAAVGLCLSLCFVFPKVSRYFLHLFFISPPHTITNFPFHFLTLFLIFLQSSTMSSLQLVCLLFILTSCFTSTYYTHCLFFAFDRLTLSHNICFTDFFFGLLNWYTL